MTESPKAKVFSPFTIKRTAGVSDLPTLENIFKRAQFLAVENASSVWTSSEISAKMRAFFLCLCVCEDMQCLDWGLSSQPSTQTK